MKIILISLIIFSSFLAQNSFSKDNGFKGGAIDNYGEVKRVKRQKITSPISTISVSTKKKSYKNSNFRSIKTTNYTEIDDLYEVEDYHNENTIYDDFDDIFYDGKYMGHYKVGNTYKIEGIPYYPQEYEDYEEIGTASWYGEKFDGKLTANGEIYNLYSMTAAHQTLPLPSVVRVTNMENGKSTIVRVNDRGPFAKNRIIDLSKRAAEILEYKDKGTTIVKVELLNDETEKLHKKLRIKK